MKTTLFEHVENICKYVPTAELRIKVILLDIGVPTHLTGYLCLQQAIKLYRQNPYQQITKELYIDVAAACRNRQTSTQVEKMIRTAIEATWKMGEKEKLRLYFPQNVDRRPSNGEFISRVACLVDIIK